jgi:isopenicillin N synthase-like dioxygenase
MAKRLIYGVHSYFTQFVDADGLAMFTEYINVPQYEMLTDEKVDFELPPWLAPYAEEFKWTLQSGNMVANVVLSVLEKELKLPVGAFTDMHRLHDQSSDFLRVLRYPGAKPGKSDPLGFPPHKDATSVSILFTWLGGLQITKKDADAAQGAEAEENWLWVKPMPGCAIVNLGDAMEVFTNQVLKSGKHRVVKAPGAQKPFDKYSVLIGTRPKNDVLMQPLESPLIPKAEKTENGSAPKVMTSKEWGTMKVRMVGEAMAKHAKKEAVY